MKALVPFSFMAVGVGLLVGLSPIEANAWTSPCAGPNDTKLYQEGELIADCSEIIEIDMDPELMRKGSGSGGYKLNVGLHRWRQVDCQAGTDKSYFVLRSQHYDGLDTNMHGPTSMSEDANFILVAEEGPRHQVKAKYDKRNQQMTIVRKEGFFMSTVARVKAQCRLVSPK